MRQAGVDFLGLGTAGEAEALWSDPRLWNHSKAFACIVERAILPNLERLYNVIQERQSADIVVGASGVCFGARIAHEKLGVPLATIHVQPTLLRSLVDGSQLGRMRLDLSVPRFWKRFLLWALDKAVIDRLLGSPVNRFRARLGLPPIDRLMQNYIHSPQLVLGLFPEWFAPMQPDWPQNTHLTGFVLNGTGGDAEIGPEAEEFLALGPPPILFTPGSNAATLSAFFRESAEACRLGGYRGMFVTDFLQQLPNELPPQVQHFSYLPFDRVLPRCAAIVHPAGIGTMALAINAGISQLVVPYSHDQPDNARRLERLGLGMKIYPERYKAAAVSEVLKSLLTDASIGTRRAERKGTIEAKPALRCACEWIEYLGLSR